MELEGSSWIDAVRLTALVGHFGTGKTEVSVNMALALAELGHKVTLADLDVVDPYFRSRECAELFARRGVGLITSSQACVNADVPALPAQVQALFEPEAGFGVLDIGGDASGARVLARYRTGLRKAGVRLLCVLNANRPMTDTAEKAVTYLQEIQAAAGLPIAGLVNNTHLCGQTAPQDILAGAELAHRVSDQTGIPLLCHTAVQNVRHLLPPMDEPVFPIRLYMKKPWE